MTAVARPEGSQAVPRPSVGVVIGVRDRPDAVRRAIRSVLSQAYPGRIECFVVFDRGAAFDLGDVAPPEGGDRVLRVIEEPRSSGLAGAWNGGAERVFGDLLAFGTEEDEWRPEKLARQVDALEASGADVAVTGVEIVRAGASDTKVPVDPSVSPQSVLHSRPTELHPTTVLVRSEAFASTIGPMDESIPGGYGAGIEWLLRAATAGEVVAVRSPLVSIHRSVDPPDTDWRTVAEAIAFRASKQPALLADRRSAARLFGRLAFAEAALGHAASARGWAMRSIRRRPVERRPYLALAVTTGIVAAGRVEAWARRIGRGI
jgi:hypothetical protein